MSILKSILDHKIAIVAVVGGGLGLYILFRGNSSGSGGNTAGYQASVDEAGIAGNVAESNAAAAVAAQNTQSNDQLSAIQAYLQTASSVNATNTSAQLQALNSEIGAANLEGQISSLTSANQTLTTQVGDAKTLEKASLNLISPHSGSANDSFQTYAPGVQQAIQQFNNATGGA